MTIVQKAFDYIAALGLSNAQLVSLISRLDNLLCLTGQGRTQRAADDIELLAEAAQTATQVAVQQRDKYRAEVDRLNAAIEQLLQFIRSYSPSDVLTLSPDLSDDDEYRRLFSDMYHSEQRAAGQPETDPFDGQSYAQASVAVIGAGGCIAAKTRADFVPGTEEKVFSDITNSISAVLFGEPMLADLRARTIPGIGDAQMLEFICQLAPFRSNPDAYAQALDQVFELVWAAADQSKLDRRHARDLFWKNVRDTYQAINKAGRGVSITPSRKKR
jgi:hypothetical protein